MLPKDLSKIITWGLLASFFVYISGWFVNFREDDAARYASLALEMVQLKSYFHFTIDPNAFGSKAVLPIKLSAISMGIFGSNHIAYRLPGLLPALLALYSVYRFSKIYYSAQVSFLATLILATIESTFIMNTEVTPENYLAAFYIFMIWQQAEYLRSKKILHLIICIAAGFLLILSKGFHTTTGHFAPFDLLVTSFWSFAPWSLVLFMGLWSRLKEIISSKTLAGRPEQMSLFGFLVPFILFSLNPYHSTQDAFIVFPLGAVVAADYIIQVFYINQTKIARTLYLIQIVLSYVLLAVLFCLVWFPFPDNNYYGLIHYLALLSVFTWLVFFSNIKHKLLLSCLIVAIGANLVLNSYFYPNMAEYQAGSQLGLLAKANGVKEGRLFSYHTADSNLLHFYSGIAVQQNNDFENLAAIKNCWIYTNQLYLEQFRSVRPDLKIIGRSPDVKKLIPQIKFLNPETREQTVTRMILIRL